MENFSSPSPEPNAAGKKKMNKNLKIGLIMSAIMVVLLIIIGIASNSGTDSTVTELAGTDAKTEDLSKFTPEQIKAKEEKERIEMEQTIISQLNEGINSIKNIDFNQFRGDVVKNKAEISLFHDWYRKLAACKEYNNPEIQKLCATYESLIVKTQKSEFPKLRADYVKSVKQGLWENNITIKCKGPKNSTMEFVGGTFVNNKNKKDFQDGISGFCNAFRFQQTNYKWIEHDDEYTYYTLANPKDDELVTSPPNF